MTYQCEDCRAAEEAPKYALYNPRCPWCGARLIQSLRARARSRPKEELLARYQEVIKTWADFGHQESELRKLSGGARATQPSGRASDGASGRQSTTRRR